MSLLEPRHKNPESITTNPPGLLLLDRKHRPIFYNAEAARILSSSINGGREQLGNGSVAAAVRAMMVHRKDATHTTEGGTEIVSWQTFAVFEKTGKRSPGMTGILIEMNHAEQKRPDVPTIAREFRLTDREEETVSHLTLGLTSKEIAVRMKVSPNTVKAFLRSIMNKMAVSTRSGILSKLIQH